MEAHMNGHLRRKEELGGKRKTVGVARALVFVINVGPSAAAGTPHETRGKSIRARRGPSAAHIVRSAGQAWQFAALHPIEAFAEACFQRLSV